MITFVNAKINIGLFVTGRRPDGYHDLETLFYPVGLHNGTPANPTPFCDILEITPNDSGEFRFTFTGRPVDCEPEKNLVAKAARLFAAELEKKGERLPSGFDIRLEKHLPDGAGLGGGSADASFTLKMLNGVCGTPFPVEELERLALRLGADCPFFIADRPAFGCGVGDRLEPSPLDLEGYWAAIVKPTGVSIPTKEAFSHVSPRPAPFDLRTLAGKRPGEWAGIIGNDFHESVFHHHPELREILKKLSEQPGALYAQMSGSGSAFYGIFATQEAAEAATLSFESTDCEVWLLRL